MKTVDVDENLKESKVELEIPQPIKRIVEELSTPSQPDIKAHLDQHINRYGKKTGRAHYNVHIDRS